ncbi:MAG: hypothetical protein WC890_01340 [Candidatus Margulisiibacteriota bacterium]
MGNSTNAVNGSSQMTDAQLKDMVVQKSVEKNMLESVQKALSKAAKDTKD